jgi:PAS domain S-box-containing protein
MEIGRRFREWAVASRAGVYAAVLLVVLAPLPLFALTATHIPQRQMVFGLVSLALGAVGVLLLRSLYRELDAAQRFFNLSAELFCTADFQGRFTRLNPAWEKTLGLPVEEILATPFLEFVHPEDRDATVAECRKLEAGGRTIHFENRYRAADGSYRWLQWSSASSLENRTIYAVAKDVTESKNVARMKDEFVSTVSHELRTPLASLRGFAELMLERDFPEPRRREFLEIIKRESTRLASLINDFLDLQRIEAGRQELRLQPRDLLPVLRQSLEMFAGTLDRHRLIQDFPESLPRLKFDADRTSQVLYNLISNAIKYSPSGGDITVGARLEGSQAVVWVQDRGLGIPAAEVEKLFTKFHRVDSSAHREIGGTGLGLALVKQLVELQGGRVWVETLLGEGSTFYFTLPVATRPALPSSPAPCLPEQAPAILIVEDDAAFTDLMRTHFEALGLRVASTSLAEVALQWLGQMVPGVILLDILLPGMSGWEFLMVIKGDERLKSVPVVVVTVSEPNGRGLALGGAEYISKTVSPDRLVHAIQTQLAGGKGKRVLLVDDDPLLRSTLSEQLRRRLDGFVEVAANGEEALHIMRTRMPDLLVLDLLMPVMDGFELLRRLRLDSRAVDVQVLVLTGKDLTEQETDYIQQRLASLVGKREMQLDYFTEVVGRALGRELQPAMAVARQRD